MDIVDTEKGEVVFFMVLTFLTDEPEPRNAGLSRQSRNLWFMVPMRDCLIEEATNGAGIQYMPSSAASQEPKRQTGAIITARAKRRAGPGHRNQKPPALQGRNTYIRVFRIAIAHFAPPRTLIAPMPRCPHRGALARPSTDRRERT